MTTNITVKQGAVGGGGAGAIAGFMILGPVGALAGAAIGAGLGAGVADIMMKNKLVIPPPAPSPHSPPAPAPTPSILGGTSPVKPMGPQPASAPVDNSIQQVTAVAMNTALASHGYKKADMPLYMAFQRAAGLAVDGLPGRNTMNKLGQVLIGANVSMAQVPLYDWHSTGAYDGVNAPTAQDWNGWSNEQGNMFAKSLVAAAPGILPTAPPISLVDIVGTPTASQVAAVIPMLMGATVVTNQDVQRALNQLNIASPLLVADGIIGPKSIAAIKTFQNSHHLVVDGIPGPITKAALTAALVGG
jgi:hypothetical protein